MKQNKISPLFGTYIGCAMIAYFLLLSLIDLHKKPIFSAFNIIIMGVGLYYTISKYKNEQNGVFKYLNGFWVIFQAGIIATFIIVAFFALYITELNDGILTEMLTTWKTSYDLTPGFAVLGLALMGFSTSVICALLLMQLFKRSWNTKEGRKHEL